MIVGRNINASVNFYWLIKFCLLNLYTEFLSVCVHELTIWRINTVLQNGTNPPVFARIEWIFETFPSVCLSFSGGKDSTVLFHLVAEVARRRKRHFSVLFIDWEAQYRCTIEHIQKMREMYHDVTETFYWVELP